LAEGDALFWNTNVIHRETGSESDGGETIRLTFVTRNVPDFDAK